MDSSAGVRMIFWRRARLLGILTLVLICVSCGDQYRPVAVPIVPPPPDPDAIHFVLVLSNNGSIDPGASSRMDVSGDTNIGVAQLGLGPAHATLHLEWGSRICREHPGGLSLIVFSKPRINRHRGDHDFPAGGFESGICPHHGERNGLRRQLREQYRGRHLGQQRNVVLNPLIPVGNHPVALAETPDQKKLYAVNQGDGTVTAISLVDRSVTQTITTGATPVWAVARSDSARIYVLNSGSGTVSAIDTVTDSVVGSVAVGAGANYMVYDSKLNRLYVTNPVANTVTALNVSADPPAVAVHDSGCRRPATVAVLPDGSRTYAVSSSKTPPCTSNPGDTQLCISSGVTVINATDGSVRKTFPLEPTVNITAATQSGNNTTYTYTLIVRSSPAARHGNRGRGHGRRRKQRNIYSGGGKRRNLYRCQ